MKTPIEEIIESLDGNKGSIEVNGLIAHLSLFLEKEKQVIIDAYNKGANDPFPMLELGSEYYKETFNKD